MIFSKLFIRVFKTTPNKTAVRYAFLLLFAVSLQARIIAGSLVIDNWLVAEGPGAVFPAFSETAGLDGEPFKSEDLFRFKPLNIENHFPYEGKIFISGDEIRKTWIRKHADNNTGFLDLQNVSGNSNPTAFLAVYLSPLRWMKTEIVIESRGMFEVYLNGESLGTKTTAESREAEPGRFSHETGLPAGKHLLMIRAFSGTQDNGDWQVRGSVNLPSYAAESDLATDVNPRQGKNITHLLDGIKTGPVTLSPDAKLYSVNYSRSLPPSDNSENWQEIKRVSDGKLVHSFRHSSIRSLSWSPAGNIIAYRTDRDDKATVWVHDLNAGEYFAVIEDVEDFGSFAWSSDGSFLVYTISEKGDDDGDLKRVLGMRDRIPGYRTRHFLYKVDIKTGIRERLTHGFLTTSLQDISPCSKMILFSQNRPDYLERPYNRMDLFLMNLETREVDTIFRDMLWGVSGQFSPDGRQLLLTGGPSAFGTPGENIPEGMIANNYDTQAYIYDLQSSVVYPITREFDPSVSQAVWSKPDNNIYLVAVEEDLVQLFRYDTKSREFTRIDTGEDVVNLINVASREPYAVLSGSGMSSPPKASLLDLTTLRHRVLENTDSYNFRTVIFGDNMEWDFLNSEGVRIPGRVYLPPDFEESEKYPLIVYYYGGTTPVSRSFGGRYPFNMYAANGYVVYVLQPSGAIGFGQEFSAMHVNNWGITVADEIIDGTRLFLDAHPFVDPDRVGCMGASYGGFMTMLLQTRTDIFAAAISHAGISSISSYWGEGYWGYGYSAEASAGSFPWNNRELYVDQSPLFSADKITTPLLLLHGSDDTNVPPGESIQLYTALKILGRPVELIKIDGEDHHILTYGKRIAWSNTKIAWLDKWLKDQSEWWEDIYPKKNF